jgi:hypothetical protein
MGAETRQVHRYSPPTVRCKLSNGSGALFHAEDGLCQAGTAVKADTPAVG